MLLDYDKRLTNAPGPAFNVVGAGLQVISNEGRFATIKFLEAPRGELCPVPLGDSRDSPIVRRERKRCSASQSAASSWVAPWGIPSHGEFGGLRRQSSVPILVL